jgi:hypothetical protein
VCSRVSCEGITSNRLPVGSSNPTSTVTKGIYLHFITIYGIPNVPEMTHTLPQSLSEL